MKRIIFILVTSILILAACSAEPAIEKLTPENIQNIETSTQQKMLFGHYENVNTAHGGSYKGCCVFNADRMKLAQFIIEFFEEETGKEFSSRDMLIGTTNEKVLVYIEPSSEMRAVTDKSYYMEINKVTAEVEIFKQGEEGPN